MGFQDNAVPYGRNYKVKFEVAKHNRFCDEAARLCGYKAGEYGGSYGLLCRLDERHCKEQFLSA